MKQSRTFVRKHAELLYGLVAATKELYSAITSITNEPDISLTVYEGWKHVGEKVKAYAKVLSPYTRGDMETGWVSNVYRPAGEESIHFKVWSSCGERDDDIYQFSVDEILAVYEQLEKIYQYEKKAHKQESLAQ